MCLAAAAWLQLRWCPGTCVCAVCMVVNLKWQRHRVAGKWWRCLKRWRCAVAKRVLLRGISTEGIGALWQLIRISTSVRVAARGLQ